MRGKLELRRGEQVELASVATVVRLTTYLHEVHVIPEFGCAKCFEAVRIVKEANWNFALVVLRRCGTWELIFRSSYSSTR